MKYSKNQNHTVCPYKGSSNKYFKGKELIKYLPSNKVNLILNNILTFPQDLRGLTLLKFENSICKIYRNNLFELIDN